MTKKPAKAESGRNAKINGTERRPRSNGRMIERGQLAALQVFDQIRDMILSLDLAPGTVLSRVALARQFGVSQTPVRDALMRLATEGLIEVFPQHATVVSMIDPAAARQAHFLRRSIELEVVRALAIDHTPEFIAQLHASLDGQRDFAAKGDLMAFALADKEFHHLMCCAANVPELWQLTCQHSGQLDRLRRLHLPQGGKIKIILADHQAIVEAISDRQPELAQAFLRKHLSGTLANIETLSARYPKYMRGQNLNTNIYNL